MHILLMQEWVLNSQRMGPPIGSFTGTFGPDSFQRRKGFIFSAIGMSPNDELTDCKPGEWLCE